MNWSISNKKLSNQTELFTGNNFSIFSPNSEIELESLNYETSAYSFFMLGFCIPTINCKSKKHSTALVKDLFKQHGFDFINFIKGSFNIILFNKDEFKIYSDHHGIVKYFIYNKDSFIISNKLKTITSEIKCTVKPENIALQALFNHYINGLTFLNDVNYNLPGSIISLSENQIRTDLYYKPEELLSLKETKINFNDFAEQFKDIINQYNLLLDHKKVSMTLTGGKDSRTILAALLNINVKPLTFTYGAKESSDVYYAEKIAQSKNLEYKNYNPINLNSEWFNQQSEEIIQQGQSLVNIHRAHRLDAIKQLQEDESKEQLFMGGYMGGELMMGVYYDNLIVTDFIKEWIFNKESKPELIKKHLQNRFFNLNNLNLEYIESYCKSLPFLNQLSVQKNEFYLQFHVAAYAHHLSDISIFMNYIKYPIAIFLDVDFLKLLFSSQYHFLKQNNASKNPFKRIKMFELNMNIQDILAPELSQFFFAKKGTYNTKEFLGNNFILIFKRIFRYYFSKKVFTSNFPMDKWLTEFSKSNLNNLSNERISQIYNITDAKRNFNSKKFSISESSWHKYTDIIMLNYLTEEFISK
jgi:hypothetical protein